MNDNFEGIHPIINSGIPIPISGVEVLGTTQDEIGKEFVVAKPLGADNDAAFTVDPGMLISGNGKEISQLLVNKCIHSVILQKPASVQKDIFYQWQANMDNAIIFIDKPGAHQRTILGKKYMIQVLNGGVCISEPLPDAVSVILVGDAKKKHEKKEGYQEFIQDLSVKLALLPRLLLVMLFSLASYWWPVFGVPTLALMLIGRTSTGKSVSQSFAANLVKGSKKMISGNFTAIGLHDELAYQGTQPVFIEDGHGKTVAQAMISAFMDAGNNAHRVRSKISSYNKESAKPITATLIVSAEKDLMSTAKEGKVVLHLGVLSRVFQVYGGEHGMFDELCGFDDGASLSAYLDALGSEQVGVFGELVLKSISSNFQYYEKNWENRKSDIKNQVLEHVDFSGCLDGQDQRILHGLAFCAFIGRIVVREKHLLIKRDDVNKSIGQLFNEHLVRKNSGSGNLSDEMHASVKSVRSALNRHKGKIKALQKGTKLRLQLKNSEVIGFEVEEAVGTYYLIKPEGFQKIMGDKLSQNTYRHLKEAGFLKAGLGRGHQYQKRLSNEQRVSFVAISTASMNE